MIVQSQNVNSIGCFNEGQAKPIYYIPIILSLPFLKNAYITRTWQMQEDI